MHDYPRLAARLYNSPLLILPAKGEVIEQVFRAHLEGKVVDVATGLTAEETAIATRLQASLGTVQAEWTEGGYLRTETGVAIIPIMGTLLHRSSWMDAASGLTGYNRIAGKLNAALEDPDTRGIVLEIDSPGGEAAGVFELASQIRAASKIKPIDAVANEEAFSAAYLLGSAAQRLYVPEPGMVGSVGVVMYHADMSRALEKRGVHYTAIYAGARKVDFSPYAPLAPEALAWAQDSVGRTYEMFTQAVARYRGISVESVKATEAAILHADQAVAAKFVTGIGTFAEAVQAMGARLELSATTIYGDRAAVTNAQSQQKEPHMSAETSAAASPSTAAVITQQQLDEAREAGRVQGATAERKRIGSILGCETAQKRPRLALHIATATDLTEEQAVAMLAAAPEEAAAATGNVFAEHMAKIPNPKIGVGAEGAATAVQQPSLNAGEIYDLRARQAIKSR